MFVRNDGRIKMYFNGKLATVTDIDGDGNSCYHGDTCSLSTEKVKWENKSYIKSTKKHAKWKKEVIGSFQPYPVQLAGDYSTQKSGAHSFDKSHLSMYAGLSPTDEVYICTSSPVRSLDGLILRSPIPASVIQARQKRHCCLRGTNNHPEQLPN